MRLIASERRRRKAARQARAAAGWLARRPDHRSRRKASKRGNDMIEITLLIPAEDGSERTIRDWFTDSPLGALKFRHAAEAVGALAKYDAGEIGAADFPGHDLKVKLTVQKRRGYPDANAARGLRAAEAGRVVNLRETG